MAKKSTSKLRLGENARRATAARMIRKHEAVTRLAVSEDPPDPPGEQSPRQGYDENPEDFRTPIGSDFSDPGDPVSPEWKSRRVHAREGDAEMLDSDGHPATQTTRAGTLAAGLTRTTDAAAVYKINHEFSHWQQTLIIIVFPFMILPNMIPG